MALPILTRLYRGKKHCPEEKYKKRTEHAREMIKQMHEWLPEGMKMQIVGDYEYVSSTVARELPEEVELMGTMQTDAVLYDPARSSEEESPQEEERLPKPKELLEGEQLITKEIQLYGKEVEIEYTGMVGRWPTVFEDRPVKVFVIRDPDEEYESRAYVTTDLEMSVETFGRVFTRRWSQ